MTLTRNERAVLNELRPYQVFSLANGHLRVEPTWPKGHGLLARLTLRDIVERILNEHRRRAR